MNKQLDLMLIRLVKATPILYDKTKFSDYNEREVAWQKIGDKLHRPAVECRERWMSIREFFRSTTLKISRANINGRPIRKKQYKYHNELSFLIPHYKHFNNTNGNNESLDNKELNDTTDVANGEQDEVDLITFDIDGPAELNDVEYLKADDDDDKDDIINGVDELKHDDDSDNNEDNTEAINFSEDSNAEIEADIETRVSKPKSNPRKRKKVNSTGTKVELNPTNAVNKIVELNPTNATDNFLIDIRAKMKKLSRTKVDKVKSKIYSIMSQYK